MKKYFKILSVIFALTLLIGCGGGGGGGGGGSVVTNPTAPTTTETPANPVLLGNSTVTASLAIPADSASIANLRAAAAQAYGVAKLFVDGELFQTKTVNVSNNALTFTFTGVKDAGTAKIEIELFNCHVYGVTKFEKSGNISASLTLTPDKIFPVNAKKTADGRVLKELGTPNNLGWVIDLDKLCFNEAGQPIGLDMTWNVKNFVTGQVYFNISSLITTPENVAFWDIEYLNGDFYVACGEIVYKVPAGYTTYESFIGVKKSLGRAVDGQSITAARVSIIDDLQVRDGQLIMMDTQQRQFIIPNGSNITVKSFEKRGYYMNVGNNGDLLISHYMHVEGTSHVARFINYAPADIIYTQNGVDGIPTSALPYNDGYLIGLEKKIAFVQNGQETVWLTDVEIGNTEHQPRFRLWQNNNKLFIVSETMNKIWFVQ